MYTCRKKWGWFLFPVSTVGSWALFILVSQPRWQRGSFSLSKVRTGRRGASLLAGHLLYFTLKRLLSPLLLCLSLLVQRNLMEMRAPCQHNTQLVWLQPVPACSGVACDLSVWPCRDWGAQPSVCTINSTNMSLQHFEGLSVEDIYRFL